MTSTPMAFTLNEAAATARQSPSTIRRAIHATDPAAFPPPLKAKRDGKGYLILAADLNAWLESLPDA
ncbi:MAG TPA: helix-turn-helix domain-containing protein [Rariglobus sp.]